MSFDIDQPPINERFTHGHNMSKEFIHWITQTVEKLNDTMRSGIYDSGIGVSGTERDIEVTDLAANDIPHVQIREYGSNGAVAIDRVDVVLNSSDNYRVRVYFDSDPGDNIKLNYLVIETR